MSLYTHWACFDCRKSFHYSPPTKEASGKRKCPECKKPMCDMGIYFEPPPSRAKKAWAIMQLLARSGYSFTTEGSKAFIDTFILTAKKPTLEGVSNRIENMKQQQEAGRKKMRLKIYKEERKDRRKQIGGGQSVRH